jgi:hypothetical protein
MSGNRVSQTKQKRPTWATTIAYGLLVTAFGLLLSGLGLMLGGTAVAGFGLGVVSLGLMGSAFGGYIYFFSRTT